MKELDLDGISLEIDNKNNLWVYEYQDTLFRLTESEAKQLLAFLQENLTTK